MTSDDGGCPLARAMRETLDAVVTPVVREALIHDALILAGLAELPQRGDAMRAFAGEYLRAVVARALGAEMAASITEEILLTIGPSTMPPAGGHVSQRPSRAPSHRRVHTPPPQTRRTPVVVRALRDTDPAGEPPSGASAAPSPTSFVLIATLDPSFLRTAVAAFDGCARTYRIRTPAELVKRLDTLDGGRRRLVLLDGENPSVRPAALAVLLEDSPTVHVVFCRARPEAEAFALSVSPSVREWTVYTDDVPLGEVVLDCVRRVSEPTSSPTYSARGRST